MNKPRVFISFDFDNDQFLRDALVGQCKNEWTPFDMEDRSVKEPRDQDERKKRCLEKIKKCDLVIVMVWEKTATCTWVKAEIKMAHEAKVPVVWLKGYNDRECPRPEWLEWYYNWTWKNVKLLVEWKR